MVISIVLRFWTIVISILVVTNCHKYYLRIHDNYIVLFHVAKISF